MEERNTAIEKDRCICRVEESGNWLGGLSVANRQEEKFTSKKLNEGNCTNGKKEQMSDGESGVIHKKKKQKKSERNCRDIMLISLKGKSECSNDKVLKRKELEKTGKRKNYRWSKNIEKVETK